MTTSRTSSCVAAFFLLLVTTVQGADQVLRNSHLDGQEIIDFFVKGHIIARNVLPELKEAAFVDELQVAKTETSRVYHEFALENLECRHDLPIYWNLLKRLKEGDGPGPVLLDKCIQHTRSKMKIKKSRNGGNRSRPHIKSEDLPFYQLIDLHQYSPRIYDVATSFKFSSMASDLLQSSRVRLYQTGTFRKAPPIYEVFGQSKSNVAQKYNSGTSWHTDLNQVPVDTNDYLTFWCPTRNVTSEDSILLYGPGSHNDMSKLQWYDNGYTRHKYSDEYEKGLSEEEIKKAKRNYHTTCRRAKKFEDAFDFSGLHENRNLQVKKRCRRYGKTTILAKASGKYRQRRRQAREEYMKNKWKNGEGRIDKQHQEMVKESKRYGIDLYDEINVGDCVIHHGWLRHGATSQTAKNGPREAMTFSYINGDDKKLGSAISRHGIPFFERDGSAEDEMSFRQWYYDIEEEDVIDHPKLILVWPQAEDVQEQNDDHLNNVEVEFETKQNKTEKKECATC